jgi:hypothetical protein
MSSIDWDHYQVALASPPTRAVRRAPKPLAGHLAGRGCRLGAYFVDRLLSLCPVVMAFILTQGCGESAETTMVRSRSGSQAGELSWQLK